MEAVQPRGQVPAVRCMMCHPDAAVFCCILCVLAHLSHVFLGGSINPTRSPCLWVSVHSSCTMRSHARTPALFPTQECTFVDAVPCVALIFRHRRGAWAAAFAFLVFAALQMPDGLFVRPHPVLWRTVTGVGVLYLCFCVFLLFQVRNVLHALFYSALIDFSASRVRTADRR